MASAAGFSETPGAGKSRWGLQPLANSKGDVLGWSWLFQPFNWNFRALAIEPVTAVSLDAAHLLACAEENHEFGYELMERVAEVVIRRLQAARHRLIEAETAGYSVVIS